MTTDERGNPLCETCGARPAMRHTLSLLGPLDIREDHRCVACQEASDARLSPVAEAIARATCGSPASHGSRGKVTASPTSDR